MRLAHQQVETARFEAPEPVLDGPTFMALLQARRKAMALHRPPPDALREVAVALREQSEESHPTLQRSAACKPAANQQAAPADSGAGVDHGVARRKQLEGERAEATARRDEAAKALAAQQQQLAEARDRLERLNEEKHVLVLQLKQALQQEGSLKRQATQGPLLSPRPTGAPGLLSPEAGPEGTQPMSFMPGQGAAAGGGAVQPAQQQPSQAQPLAPQGRREGRGRQWASEDEGDAMEEGEVAPSPQRMGAWHDGQPGAGPSGPMRGGWLSPPMQLPGSMPRQPGWGQQPPPPPPPHGGPSQLPPHLARQNSGTFQQGGYMDMGPGMRGRPPAWGSRDGSGPWQSRGPYS